MVKRILKNVLRVLIIAFVAFFTVSVCQNIRVHISYENKLEAYGQTATVNGNEIFYREAGSPGNPTIVMIHGFMGSSYDFINVIDSMKDDYHVIAVDLVGFGLSEKSVTFEYYKANQAEMVAALLEQKGIASYSLLGHSMGGEVALHIAYHYPSRVEQLILVDAAGLQTDRQAAFPVSFYDAIFKNYYVQKVFLGSAYYDKSVATQSLFDEMYFFNRQIPAKVMQRYSKYDDSGNIGTHLEEITANTLIIWGEKDTFIPLHFGEEMFARLPNAQMTVIAASGHLPFDEKPSVFLNILNDFLGTAI